MPVQRSFVQLLRRGDITTRHAFVAVASEQFKGAIGNGLDRVELFVSGFARHDGLSAESANSPRSCRRMPAMRPTSSCCAQRAPRYPSRRAGSMNRAANSENTP